MKGVRSFKKRLAKDLKDPAFRRAFEEEEIYAGIAINIARLRDKKKLSQKELAELVGTTQQTISRIEDPRNTSLSIDTLIRIADALGKRVEVKIA